MTMEKKLQRIPHEGAVAGVCAGLGVYFGIDKTWVRLAFIVSVFFSGFMGIGLLGPIVYIVLWIVLPIKSFAIPSDPFDVNYRTPENPAAAAFDDHNPYAWDSVPKPPPLPRRSSNDRYIAGVILLAVGLFFLLHQLDVFYWRDFVRFWPVLIIIMGLASIFGAFNNRKQPPLPFENESKRAQGTGERAADGDPDLTYTK